MYLHIWLNIPLPYLYDQAEEGRAKALKHDGNEVSIDIGIALYM